MHNGGAFPTEIEVPLRNPTDANPVGDYTLELSNFQVGRYKNLELNPFDLKLKVLTANSVTQQSSQQAPVRKAS